MANINYYDDDDDDDDDDGGDDGDDDDDPCSPDQKLSKDEVSQLIKRQTSFENDSHLSPTPTLQPPPLSSQSSPQHAMTTSVAGLKTSDAWKDDGTPVRKKVARTDSQKKEKRQRTLSMKTNKKVIKLLTPVNEAHHRVPHVNGLTKRC